MVQQQNRANLLVQALPYIQKFNKKTIVIKYGGNAMVTDVLKDAVVRDIVLLSLVGINIVLVHGGGPEINDMLNRVNKQSHFVDGLRYTDKETMEIVQQVLCGRVNKNIVSMINKVGGKAVGLCGMDGGMIRAAKLKGEKDYGLVGEIVSIDPKLINDVLERGYIPVVSGIAQGVDGEEVYNINADTAAAKLAVALGAIKLILLTDVRGVMADAEDEDTLVSVMNLSDVEELKKWGIPSSRQRIVTIIPREVSDCGLKALSLVPTIRPFLWTNCTSL